MAAEGRSNQIRSKLGVLSDFPCPRWGYVNEQLSQRFCSLKLLLIDIEYITVLYFLRDFCLIQNWYLVFAFESTFPNEKLIAKSRNQTQDNAKYPTTIVTRQPKVSWVRKMEKISRIFNPFSS